MTYAWSAPGAELLARAALPIPQGDFELAIYRVAGYRDEQVVLSIGLVANATELLVRVHSECLTGDAFGSLRCDCGQQLQASFCHIADAGSGIVIYVRGHEGRGIGLAAKVQAYALQQTGLDTVDANLAMGLPVDARDYRQAAAVLKQLGVLSIRLLTNNPEKARALEKAGVPVKYCVPLIADANSHNTGYLRTKRERMSHTLPASISNPS